jgi:hypothetical protein
MENKEHGEVRYDKRFVAFVDILGFKDAILNDKVPKLIKTIQQLRSEAGKKPYILEREDYIVFLAGEDEENKFHDTRQISVFSDLIVISYPVYNEKNILNNLHKLIHSIYFVQEHLVPYGILLRGGITVGDLYHKDDVCIGPALIRAYELESSIAKFPRTILDKAITDDPQYSGITRAAATYLEQFRDDFYFITHFKPIRTFFDMYPDEHIKEQVRTRRLQVLQILYSYKLVIEKALNSGHTKTIEKGDWLKEQYVEAVKYFESFYQFTTKERQYVDIVMQGL